MAVPCWSVSLPTRPSPCSGRLLSTITEPTSAGHCDPPLVEETSSSPPVSEESEVDRTDHSGKKVCFKVSEDEQEDSGHDTMSYRDSYRCVRPKGGHPTIEASDLWESQDCDISQDAGGSVSGANSVYLEVGGAGSGGSKPLRECSGMLSWLPYPEL